MIGRTVEQIRAGIPADKINRRICLGHDGVECFEDVAPIGPLVQRCNSCRRKRKNDQNRSYNAKRRLTTQKVENAPQPAAVEYSDTLTRNVVADVRKGHPNCIIAETYGITKEDVRVINCAHYQRKARIAA